MALIICPECGRDISDKAVSCPHCGYPLDKPPESHTLASSNVSEPARASAAPKSRKTAKWLLITAAALAVILLLVYTVRPRPVTKSNLDIDGMYNDVLGVGVKLGMSKSSVDEILGTPKLEFEMFSYPNGLYVSYVDGKVSALSIQYVDDAWKTKGGVTLGMTDKDLAAALGDPNSIEHDNEWWYYFSGNCVLGLRVLSGTIRAVYIYDRTKVGQNQDAEPSVNTEDAQKNDTEAETRYTDARGISGFDAGHLIEALEVDFFNPDNDKTESWVRDANISAHSETDGVQVDYYITVDDDNELYFAGFEARRAAESDLTEDELVDMASCYFLIPLTVKYDGSDAEKVISWLPEAFERIDTSEKSSMGGDLTVGAACFSVGYTDGIYTLIIDKQITP